MCDESFDNFDGDFDGEPGNYEDDGFRDEDFQDSGPEEHGDSDSEKWEIPWDGLQWQDWMIIGPLSEEIAREKREKEPIRRKMDI